MINSSGVREFAEFGDVRAVEIFVEPRDLAAFDLADDRAGQAHFGVVVDALALQNMLLDEAAGKGGEPALGIFAVLDPRDHAGQRLRGLRGGDDQLVGVVPDLAIGGETALHRFDVARLDRVEKTLRHCANVVLLCHDALLKPWRRTCGRRSPRSARRCRRPYRRDQPTGRRTTAYPASPARPSPSIPGG